MYLNLDGIKINYIKLGKGPDAILIHGVFGEIESYKKLTEILSKHYCVYSFDLPMQGRSGNLKNDTSLNGLVKMFDEFIKKLKIDNPTIIAHSAGGLIAIKYASKNKVKELILMNSAGLKVDFKKVTPLNMIRGTINSFRYCKGNLFDFIALISLGFINYFKNLLNPKFKKLFDECVKTDLSKELKKIDCPVKLIWGKNDTLFDIKYALRMKAKLKKSKLVLMNTTTHDWPIFEPERIIRYLPKWANNSKV